MMFSNNSKKTIFLTLDLEEWYHLEYLKKYNLDKNNKLIPELTFFFEFLSDKNISITIFILGELINENSELIKEISKYHEISIHGWNHDLLYEKTEGNFKEEIKKTKATLEDLTGKEVVGYRAPCFSMSNEKLDWLQELGIEY
ncbi:MAG: polysaccharide deacetylase family protein, partial [Pelagibacterales bacterium]|nr:polysaccharide deacetylase family protein [Pelagibacterales bacterium]